jgi:hypothetical protein
MDSSLEEDKTKTEKLTTFICNESKPWLKIRILENELPQNG